MSKFNKLNGILDGMLEGMIVAEQDIEIGGHRVKEIVLQVTRNEALLVWKPYPLGKTRTIWCDFIRHENPEELTASSDHVKNVQKHNPGIDALEACLLDRKEYELTHIQSARGKVARLLCEYYGIEVPSCYLPEHVSAELQNVRERSRALWAKSWRFNRQHSKGNGVDEIKKVNFREFI